VATEVLRNTVNIPPTITKHQGADVTIFIRYPIDFSDAYQLRIRR
jgi:type IV secretion system protein VirB10